MRSLYFDLTNAAVVVQGKGSKTAVQKLGW